MLIVSDDANILAKFKIALQEHGYQVDTYQDPYTALANFGPGRYDLLLVDIYIPKMDGFRFFGEIQKLDPCIKAFFITAYKTSCFNAIREIFPDLDIGCYINKSIVMVDLVKQIGLALST